MTPALYGGLSTQPLPLPRGHAAPIRTLAELYGARPTAQQVLKGLKALPDAKEADLLRWAVMQGVPLNTELITPLFAAGASHTQETCLLGLYYHRDDIQAVRLALTAIYAHPAQATPRALTLANLLNMEMNLNLRDALPALLAHEDLSVFVSAARALAHCGTAADLQTLATTRDALLAKLAAGPEADTAAGKQRKEVYEEQFKLSMDELAQRIKNDEP